MEEAYRKQEVATALMAFAEGRLQNKFHLAVIRFVFCQPRIDFFRIHTAYVFIKVLGFLGRMRGNVQLLCPQTKPPD